MSSGKINFSNIEDTATNNLAVGSNKKEKLSLVKNDTVRDVMKSMFGNVNKTQNTILERIEQLEVKIDQLLNNPNLMQE
jgi:2-hydroxy-3-keto-5-methylthiopentenyl-1-phosphate phosphatase